MDNKGKIAWQTIAIGGLLILIVGLVAGWIENPFDEKGNIGVSLGYILEDGTEVPLNSGGSDAMFMDPGTLWLYTDSTKTQKISGLYGQLSVNAATDLDVDNEYPLLVGIVWSGVGLYRWGPTDDWDPWPGLSNISGSTSIPPNTQTTIDGARLEAFEPGQVMSISEQTAEFSFAFTVNASANGKTATGSAVGYISLWYSPDTGVLSITATVSTGTLEIV